MTGEKPLHVRVAEALGCKPEPFVSVGRGLDLTVSDAWACRCLGSNKGEAHGSILGVYHYDTDWAATGPLVERYRLELLSHPFDSHLPAEMWVAGWHIHAIQGEGKTPLIAICNLILTLYEAGKLKEVA